MEALASDTDITNADESWQKGYKNGRKNKKTCR